MRTRGPGVSSAIVDELRVQGRSTWNPCARLRCVQTLDLAPDQRAALARFVERLRASPHNLVSRRAREELWTRHVPECLDLAAKIPVDARQLLDVGSGGGLPGLVLAVARPDLEVHLLDSTAKKTAFLTEVSTELGLGVTVHTGRAEELGRGALGGRFDVVTARAVAPLVQLVAWCAPLLSPEGCLYAVKGKRWADELADAAPALRRSELRVVATPDEVVHNRGASVPDPQLRVVILARSG